MEATRHPPSGPTLVEVEALRVLLCGARRRQRVAREVRQRWSARRGHLGGMSASGTTVRPSGGSWPSGASPTVPFLESPRRWRYAPPLSSDLPRKDSGTYQEDG